jgi:hypothetical protein
MNISLTPTRPNNPRVKSSMTPTRPETPRVKASMTSTRRDIPSVHPTIREMPSIPPPPSGTNSPESEEIRRPTLYGVAPPSRQIVKPGPGTYSQVALRDRKSK